MNPMATRLVGKVAIVTASTAGIGLGIARRLAQEGASVMVSSRKAENVKATVDMLHAEGLDKVHGTVCHVGNDEDRKRLVQETMAKFGGRIDALISNAASNPAYGPLQDITPAQWDKIMDTNVKATFFLTKEIIPIMREQKSGSIVMISSIGGYTPLPGIGCYCVSKTALFGLSRVISAENAGFGVRCNVIAPGIVKTNFSEALWNDPKMADRILKQVPLGRFGESEDIAGAAAFLASSDASYITGETLTVSGGMMASKL